MDMEFGPEGDLYMLEYGTAWFLGNDDARLVKIEFNGGNRKPQIRMAADKPKGAVPLTPTLKLAAWPSSTVWLTGCWVMATGVLNNAGAITPGL